MEAVNKLSYLFDGSSKQIILCLMEAVNKLSYLFDGSSKQIILCLMEAVNNVKKKIVFA
jgi:hypothetical protein